MSKRALTVIKNEATKVARIQLFGVIGDFWSEYPLTAAAFIKELTFLEMNFDKIIVDINSPGGNVWEGLAIANAIRRSPKTHTNNMGIAASMAAIILAAAGEGRRHASKGSLTMIHNASTIAWGNSEDLRRIADELDVHDDVLAGFLADATGKTLEEVKSLWFDSKDHYLTAEEGAKIGLFDIADQLAENVPDDVTNLNYGQIAALFGGKINTPSNNNEDMSLFTNKFKKLGDLAKVAANAITADQLQEANAELEANEVKGVSLILDSALQEHENKLTTANNSIAEKDTQISNLNASISTKDGEIKNLKDQLAAAQAKLNEAGEEPNTPPAGEKDKQPGEEPKKEDYETSIDAEYRAMWGGK